MYPGTRPDIASEEHAATADDMAGTVREYPSEPGDDDLAESAAGVDDDIVVGEVIDEPLGAADAADHQPVVTDTDPETPDAADAADHQPVVTDTDSETPAAADPADDMLGATPAIDDVPAASEFDDGTGPPDLSPAGGDTTPAGPLASADLDQEWRDIQAAFVDDPRGAVRMAADATGTALSALIESLRERQSAVMSSEGSAGMQDTEHLRAALRQYRTFCQKIGEMGRHMPLAG